MAYDQYGGWIPDTTYRSVQQQAYIDDYGNLVMPQAPTPAPAPVETAPSVRDTNYYGGYFLPYTKDTAPNYYDPATDKWYRQTTLSGSGYVGIDPSGWYEVVGKRFDPSVGQWYDSEKNYDSQTGEWAKGLQYEPFAPDPQMSEAYKWELGAPLREQQRLEAEWKAKEQGGFGGFMGDMENFVDTLSPLHWATGTSPTNLIDKAAYYTEPLNLVLGQGFGMDEKEVRDLTHVIGATYGVGSMLGGGSGEVAGGMLGASGTTAGAGIGAGAVAGGELGAAELVMLAGGSGEVAGGGMLGASAAGTAAGYTAPANSAAATAAESAWAVTPEAAAAAGANVVPGTAAGVSIGSIAGNAAAVGGPGLTASQLLNYGKTGISLVNALNGAGGGGKAPGSVGTYSAPGGYGDGNYGAGTGGGLLSNTTMPSYLKQQMPQINLAQRTKPKTWQEIAEETRKNQRGYYGNENQRGYDGNENQRGYYGNENQRGYYGNGYYGDGGILA